MTNKPKGCGFYHEETGDDCHIALAFAEQYVDANHTYCKCKQNPDCYYKQLARKTEECEKLINKNNRLGEELNQIKLLLEGKNTQYEQKLKECENNKILYQNELNIYNQACADLKEELDNAYEELQAERRRVEELEKELLLNEKTINRLIKQSDSYKQALEEIKAMLETIMETNKIVILQNNLAKLLQKCEVLNDIN